jgi:glutathione S-transferase
MPVTLYGYPFSTYTASARAALAEKGVAYTLVRPEMQTPDYGALHPFFKMPVLDHDGFRVWEAAAVMRYVDEAFAGPALQPADVKARAVMTQWISAFNDYVAPRAVRGVLIPRFVLARRGIPVDDTKVHAAAAEAHKALAVFDRALAEAPYLAGAALSLADLLLAPAVASGARLSGEDRYTDGLEHLAEWLGRVVTRPSFAAAGPG